MPADTNFVSSGSWAPIALFVYNRPRHTQQAVEALQKNRCAAESDLHIFSDGSRNADAEERVLRVREYIDQITGFRSVTVIKREKNLGLANSIISGVTDVVNRYGRVIVLEDDLIVSPYFLQFMNDALEFYRDDERVVSIHGYMFPLGSLLPETFFLKDTGCWGWATWKRGWDLFEADGGKLLKELERRDLTRTFDMNGSYGFTDILRDQVAGKNDSWAIRWQASAFLDDKLTVFPGRSLVRNIGNDGSGTHCTETNCFDVMLSDTPVRVGRIPVEENAQVLGRLRRYFRGLQPSVREKAGLVVRRMADWFRR